MKLTFIMLGVVASVHGEITSQKAAFDISWPPSVEWEKPKARRPLLNGTVNVSASISNSPSPKYLMHITVTLSRETNERARRFWNYQLRFPEYSWIEEVKTWDEDMQWLWPNLPYLLKLNGVDRVERYGGIDPSKMVDNDFAAVFAKGIGSSSNLAQAATANSLPDSTNLTTTLNSVIHTAKADTLTIEVPSSAEMGLWLIYADFMGAKLPETWPKEKEFEGGILAYFTIKWDISKSDNQAITVTRSIPLSATGFDWEDWSTQVKLTE